MKHEKFKKIDSDMDSAIYERIIKGRLTKKRYKIIAREVRKMDIGSLPNCGHEYDCCGCLCYQWANFTHKYNLTIIKVGYSYNY